MRIEIVTDYLTDVQIQLIEDADKYYPMLMGHPMPQACISDDDEIAVLHVLVHDDDAGYFKSYLAEIAIPMIAVSEEMEPEDLVE